MAPTTEIVRKQITVMMRAHHCLVANLTSHIMASAIHEPTVPISENDFCGPFLSRIRPYNLLENIGITDTETKRLKATAQVTAMAMSRNSWPASSSIKTTGRKTAMVVRVEARMAPQTSRAP